MNIQQMKLARHQLFFVKCFLSSPDARKQSIVIHQPSGICFYRWNNYQIIFFGFFLNLRKLDFVN